MAKLLHIFYHKEGTFSLLCQQVQYFTLSNKYLINNSIGTYLPNAVIFMSILQSATGSPLMSSA